MAVDSVSIEDIKALINQYNIILTQYIAANKSLTSLGSYDVLSNKQISGGTPSYSAVSSTVDTCQAKCAEFKCSAAAYNSDTKVCQINNNGQIIGGTLSQQVIVNKQIYYLNQLNNLNTQLSQINTQIIAKIYTINNYTLNNLHDERVRLKSKLDVDKAALSQQMETANNLMHNKNVLDLEYIRQDEALATNSRYSIFLVLALMCLIAIVVLIITQIKS